MTRQTLLILPLLILIALGTALGSGPSLDEDKPDEKPKRPGITKVEPGTKIKDIKSDAFTMGAVTIEGDVLKIKVTYGGGAKEHDFTLYWNQIVARSYPGKTTINLKHDANGDNAEALLTETLEFDLTAINKPMIITVATDHGDKATVQYGKSKLD
ncbi:MAG: hypothetical protein AB8C95_00500 [Phycisphaeraceae bacterium]